MTSFAGGGGGAIYKDGQPVSVQLDTNESTTVPTGETWDVTTSVGHANGNVVVRINGIIVSGYNANLNETSATADVVLKAGDTVKISGSGSPRGCIISGWVL